MSDEATREQEPLPAEGEPEDPEDQARAEPEEDGTRAPDEETPADEGTSVDEADEGEGAPRRPGMEKTRPQVHGEAHLKSVLESLVFVTDKPVTVQKLAKITRAKPSELQPLLDALVEEYKDRGLQLLQVGGGYQFRSAAVNAPFVRDMVAKRPVRLTRAQLETMAIVAYRQPVTRPEVEDIRGVDSGSAMKVLADRGLVKILGRKDEPGRPLIYGTTPYFLELFGLNSLKDLPTLEEFTELSEESRTLFQSKMDELDLSQMADIDEIPESTEDDDTSQENDEEQATPAEEPPDDDEDDEDEDD
ncbi:MAG: SMC-Scp complex subunit ScpB [Myxococcota bacterium]